MKAVIAALNESIDRRPGPHYFPEPHVARAALNAIETQEMAITALRTVVAHPKNPESIAHAERLLKLIDDYLAKHAPKPADVAPAKTPEPEQDVSDLV